MRFPSEICAFAQVKYTSCVKFAYASEICTQGASCGYFILNFVRSTIHHFANGDTSLLTSSQLHHFTQRLIRHLPKAILLSYSIKQSALLYYVLNKEREGLCYVLFILSFVGDYTRVEIDS